MQPIIPQEQFIDLHFPAAGMDLSQAFSDQPNRPVTADKAYARSTRSGVNVRGYEPAQRRARGGSRPGLAQYPVGAAVVAQWLIQNLNQVTFVGGSPVQTSQSGRVVTLIAVSQGNVYYTFAGGTTWTAATNNTGHSPPLNFSGLMQSTALNQKLWFADGINWCYYKADTQSVEAWTASAGTLPADVDGNTPRLICTWRGRIVLSGLIKDPQSIFMSAVGNPQDFDYSPLSQSSTQAVALTTGSTGVVADVVTGLIPYNDDVLVILGDHSIFLLRGDPMAGGQVDLVTDAIGGAYGQAWAKDPYGNIYFVSNQGSVYTMVPGQAPQRISQPIEQQLQLLDTGTHTFRLIWNDRFQGLHVFCSTTSAPPLAPDFDTHFFWEQRTGAWWVDIFGNQNHNPLTCVTFDGNLPTDRAALIGSWDGYVRAVEHTAATDDGYPISSAVVIGPLLTKDLDEMMLKELQAVLGEQSGRVTYSVFVGRSAEHALSTAPVSSGTWDAGRNPTLPVRRAGHAVYVQLASTSQWALEQIRALVATKGKVRRRTP